MNQDDGTYGVQGGPQDQDSTGRQQDLVRWNHGAVENPGGPSFPMGSEGGPLKPQKPPIPVRHNTLKIMLGAIAALLVISGALAFVAFGSHKTPVTVVTAASSSPVVETTAADPGLSPSPSLEVSDPPSDTADPFSTDTSISDSASDAVPSDTTVPSGSFSPVFGVQSLGGPVDGSVETGEDVHISNVDYPDSIGMYCPTSNLLDWNVAGFATFTAEFGIPDDARSATAITNTMTFTDQNGQRLGVAKTSIGQPAHVQFALKGATRLIVSCDRQGSNDSVNNVVALGNASVSTS